MGSDPVCSPCSKQVRVKLCLELSSLSELCCVSALSALRIGTWCYGRVDWCPGPRLLFTLDAWSLWSGNVSKRFGW